MLTAGVLKEETGILLPTKSVLLAATEELAGSYNGTGFAWQGAVAMALKSPLIICWVGTVPFDDAGFERTIVP